jgi:hypothetical protein
MKCPDAIAEIILEILRTGLLNIRYQAASGMPERCVIEADHIHNLPTLLSRYSPDLLRFYLEVEREAFERCSDVRGCFDEQCLRASPSSQPHRAARTSSANTPRAACDSGLDEKT